MLSLSNQDSTSSSSSDDSSALASLATSQTSSTSTDSTSTTQTSSTGSDSSDRETYGLAVLKNMSDSEYSAFERATSDMSVTQKIQAAQSLQLLATSYQQAQTALSGGGLAQMLSGDSQSGFFQTNPSSLTQGIQVLSQMNSNDAQGMASFLKSYSAALSTNSLNISA